MPILDLLKEKLQQLFQLSMRPLDAKERYPVVWVAMIGGAGLGLTWGIMARIWMRLISTNPEFSIGGTTAILLIATLFGFWVGLAFTARRRGWQWWGHYVPRSLVVIFFIPFGAFGGAPLMLTVLIATLALTQRLVFGTWVLALMTILFRAGESEPGMVTILASASALVLTIWRWLVTRWHDNPTLLKVDLWLERVGRTLLFGLAVVGFGYIAREIVSEQPAWLSPVYILYYFLLLYPLFLALRVGLAPRVSISATNE